MRIALVVDCYPPSRKSAAKLVQDLAEEFVSRGHAVAVITVDDTLDAPVAVQTEGLLSVCRVRTGPTKDVGLVRRAINEILLSPLVWRRAKPFLESFKGDLVVYYSPTIFFGGLVAKLKSLWGAKSYLILRDIFPDWAVEVGVFGKGPIYWFFKIFEQLNYRAADTIAVQSPANVAYFGNRSAARVEVLYNWTTCELPARRALSYRTEFGLEGKTVFVYGGNIGVAQDMDNILRLAERLRTEADAHFLLVGEGSEFDRVQAAITARGLTNVSLRPALGQDEYLSMLHEFDIGLISLDRRLRSANVPGKLLGYLECALPTLASINPGNDLGELLESAGAGLVSVNPDDERFRANALELLHDRDARTRMSENARHLLHERFDVRATASQILESATSRHLSAVDDRCLQDRL